MAAPNRRDPGRLFDRLLWFVLIYCGSALAFAALVYGLRAIIPH